jgi:hypothetical protein
MGKEFDPGEMINHVLVSWQVQDDIRHLYRLKVGWANPQIPQDLIGQDKDYQE